MGSWEKPLVSFNVNDKNYEQTLRAFLTKSPKEKYVGVMNPDNGNVWLYQSRDKVWRIKDTYRIRDPEIGFKIDGESPYHLGYSDTGPILGPPRRLVTHRLSNDLNSATQTLFKTINEAPVFHMEMEIIPPLIQDLNLIESTETQKQRLRQMFYQFDDKGNPDNNEKFLNLMKKSLFDFNDPIFRSNFLN